MSPRIYPSSSLMTKSRKKHDFPWEQLECGQSFNVPITYMKKESLRALCSMKGGELRKKFRLAVHDSHYEIGRIK